MCRSILWEGTPTFPGHRRKIVYHITYHSLYSEDTNIIHSTLQTEQSFERKRTTKTNSFDDTPLRVYRSLTPVGGRLSVVL